MSEVENKMYIILIIITNNNNNYSVVLENIQLLKLTNR